MNNAERDKAAKRPPPRPLHGLEGRCFLWFTEEGKRNYQGRIVTHLPGDVLLIQHFDWIIGAPSTMKLIRLADMIGKIDKHDGDRFVLFANDEHLRDWCDGNPERE